MKKFLSLMLAMIMVMSLVTVGAGAFSDDATIEQKEAVALLSGLGIIGGYDDGSFNPTGTLSRGAAAKIITWMSIGTAKVEALAEKGVEAKPFEDVRLDSSYAVFVEYCKENDIVSGYDDGKFLPYADLSGHAFIKMALKALGVTDIDFTVKGWQVDAVARAEEMDLLKGIDEEVKLNLALSRENACQIAFNALGYTAKSEKSYVIVAADEASAALKALAKDETVYASRSEAMAEVLVIDKDAVYGEDFTITEKAISSLGAKNFNLVKTEGIVKSNGATESTLADAKKTVLETEAGNVTIKKCPTDLSLIGHYVTIYTNSKTNEVYAIIDNSTTLKLSSTLTVGELKAALDEDEIALSEDYTEYNNGYVETTASFTAETLVKGNADDDTLNKTSGTLIIYAGEILGYVPSTQKRLAYVVDIDADEANNGKGATITISTANGTLVLQNNATTDAVKEYAGVAEKDYVVVTQNNEIYNLAKATTVTGKVTKVDNGTTKKVTIGGTTYSKTGADWTGSYLENKKTAAQLTLGQEYTLYLSGTSFLAIVPAKDVTDVVYLADVAQKAGTGDYVGAAATDWAICVDMNGNIVEYRLNDAEKAAITSGSDVLKGLYTVANKYDTVGKFTYGDFTAATDEQTTTAAITDETLKIADGHYFTEDVKFISVTGTITGGDLKVVVKTGAQDIASGSSKYYLTDSELVEAGKNVDVKFVFVAGAFATPDVDPLEEVVYAIESSASVISTTYEDADGNSATAYQHTVYIDGVKTTILTDDSANLNGFVELTQIQNIDTVVYTARAYTYGTAADEDNIVNLVKYGTVSNIYKNLITVTGYDNAAIDAREDAATFLADLDATDAEIIDLRKDLKIVTKDKDLFTKLDELKDHGVALVLDGDDDDGYKVAMIYVVD